MYTNEIKKVFQKTERKKVKKERNYCKKLVYMNYLLGNPV